MKTSTVKSPRGLLLRQPDFDIVRVQDVGLAVRMIRTSFPGRCKQSYCSDASSDHRATMPDYAYERLASGEMLAGVFIVNDRLPVGQAIQEILLIDSCSEQAEWSGRAVHLPL